MKRIILILAICIINIQFSYAENKPIQFRLVLSEREAENEPHDIFDYKVNPVSPVKKIFVSKNVALSNEDIKEVFIVRAENRYKQYPEGYATKTDEGVKTLEIPHEERKGWYEDPEIKILFRQLMEPSS